MPNTTADTQSTGTTEHKRAATKSGTMAQDDRRAFVLETLEAAGVPLKSIDVFRACKLRGATFERRTTKNYLTQLLDSADVLKVDSQALDDGEIVEIDRGERGHFIAASAAEQYGHRDR